MRTASFLIIPLSVLISFSSASAAPEHQLRIPKNGAEIIELPDNFTNVSISDKSVARVIRHGDNKASIIGKQQGRARVDFAKAGGQGVYRANVEVTYDVPSVKMAIRRFFPAETVDVELVNNTITLSGLVTDAEIAYRVEQLAKQHLGSGSGTPIRVVNLMQVRAGQQVMLRVQVGEVQQGALGVDSQGIISSSAKSRFDDLVGRGEVRLMAEPSLVAISGETAEFLAGGELPIPVGDIEDGKIDYKPYGVKVEFTPQVLSQSRIRLTVAPEVSELSSEGSIEMNGTSIPGIRSRRVKTTVEMAPGESFMIAGLIKQQVGGNSGGFMSGTRAAGEQSELVIMVTPYLVNPIAHKNAKLPTDVLQKIVQDNPEQARINTDYVSGMAQAQPSGGPSVDEPRSLKQKMNASFKSSGDYLQGSYGPMVE